MIFITSLQSKDIERQNILPTKPTMEKYFNLLLDLLEIKQNQNYSKILKIIQKNKDKKIFFYHQYSFIFEWYQKLLNQELALEEFLQIWDINSKLKIDSKKIDSISFLQNKLKIDPNSIYIFDSIAQWFLSEQANIFYC